MVWHVLASRPKMYPCVYRSIDRQSFTRSLTQHTPGTLLLHVALSCSIRLLLRSPGHQIGYEPLIAEAVPSSSYEYPGALIILFFGALNKVAGVYGLISAFVGGSALQLSFYAYSAATLVIVAWGIRVVSAVRTSDIGILRRPRAKKVFLATQESTSKTTRFSHLYAIDHVIQTLYALSFARHQWFGVSHDGARGDLSVAQQDLVDLAIRRGEIPAQRPSDTAAIAHGLWEQEKTFIGFVLIVAWLVKVSLPFSVVFKRGFHLIRASTRIDIFHLSDLLIRRSPSK
jgi:hypothetical protein